MRTPTEEELQGDLEYIWTSQIRFRSLGSKAAITWDAESLKLHPSVRWYRVWQKNESGWVFIGVKRGAGGAIHERTEVQTLFQLEQGL